MIWHLCLKNWVTHWVFLVEMKGRDIASVLYSPPSFALIETQSSHSDAKITFTTAISS